MDSTISLVEPNPTMGEGEQGVIPAHSHVLSGLKFRAPLADDDRTRGDRLPSKTFHAEPLAAAIATVPCGSLSLFMCHDLLLGYLPAWIF